MKTAEEWLDAIAEARNCVNSPPDPERRHIDEDELAFEFIQERADFGNVVAKALVEMRDDDVPRWYA